MQRRETDHRAAIRLRNSRIAARTMRDTQRVTAHGIAKRPIAPVHTLWRVARQWIAANTFEPQWLPQRWRIPGAPYVLAVLLAVTAALATLLLFVTFPYYILTAAIEMLAVALVALSMGGGPSLMATLAGGICLGVLILPRVPFNALPAPVVALHLLVFLIAGVAISLVAGGSERTRQRLQREQAATQARALAAREMNERMDEFLSILSHELRSPLAGIKAGLQLLGRRLSRLAEQEADERPDTARRLEQALDTLAIAEREVERQNRLIGDLLDISRIRAGKLEYHMAQVDLAPLVREAAEAQQLAWPERAIMLVVPETPIPVCVDTDRIAQVVTNFLTNALKYAPGDQPIEVTLSLDAHSARIAVRDHGPGLSREQQRHIWERFHRVPGIQQQGGSAGLGLGLYICKTIAERHSGTVGVESAPGRGATFWITLPLLSA